MSANKATVERYIDGFNKVDHEQILSCVTDDVEWHMPGFFHHFGKAAFDGEIENDAFTGKPTVVLTRITEGNNVVIAEGSVKAAMKTGGTLDALFCDVFEMTDAKIKKLTTYLMTMMHE
jgi:ketosteroid isomerase-like protein